jgi:hypothetical protein
MRREAKQGSATIVEDIRHGCLADGVYEYIDVTAAYLDAVTYTIDIMYSL